MADEQADNPPADVPDLDTPVPPPYPEGTVGDLMRQRDQARSAAQNIRDRMADLQSQADTMDLRAASMQSAIDALNA